jgi:hypothetical protein
MAYKGAARRLVEAKGVDFLMLRLLPEMLPLPPGVTKDPRRGELFRSVGLEPNEP